MTVMFANPQLGHLCDCGCGERLPTGSSRKYKRGHKARVNAEMSAAMDEQLGIPADADNPGQLDWSMPPEWFDDNGEPPLSIDDAAGMTPDDPDSNDAIWDDVKNISPRVRKDVQGKLAFMFSMTANMVTILDPVCGPALQKQTPEITKALTPLLCQSSAVVAWFQKTSNFMLYVNLMMAVWPVLVALYGHHLKGHEDEQLAPMNGQMNINPNMYGVQ